MVAVSMAAAMLCGWRFHVRAGGITGDFLGATQQVCEGDGPSPKLQVHGTLQVHASLRSPEMRQDGRDAGSAAARLGPGARSGTASTSAWAIAVNRM